MKLDKTKIKGILIDSGYVLIYPSSENNWFISPKMLDLLEIHDTNSVNLLKNSIKNAHYILDKYPYVLNKDDEIRCFNDFYKVVLNDFNANLNVEKLALELAEDITINPIKYCFYEDSKPIISLLQESFKIALVSDAWPSMRLIYDYNDMTKYFDKMVISSELGVLKPDALMYKTALEGIGLLPEECIFLDDNIDNCIGAKKLGIIPILVSRNHEDYIINCKKYKDYINIENLEQLKEILF